MFGLRIVDLIIISMLVCIMFHVNTSEILSRGAAVGLWALGGIAVILILRAIIYLFTG